MAWITDAVLKSAYASRRQFASSSSLPDHASDAAAAANASAYGRIRGILLGRGFTAAELDAWDDREQWNTDVGITFLEWKTGDGDARLQAWEELKALLEMLEELPIVIDGEVVTPSGSGARVGTGDFDTTDDTFTPDSVL